MYDYKYKMAGVKWSSIERAFWFRDRYDYIQLCDNQEGMKVNAQWRISLELKVDKQLKPEYIEGDIYGTEKEVVQTLVSSCYLGIHLRQFDQNCNLCIYVYGTGELQLETQLLYNEWYRLAIDYQHGRVKVYVNDALSSSLAVSLPSPLFRIGTGFSGYIRKIHIDGDFVKEIMEITDENYDYALESYEMSKGSRKFLDHGLQVLVWIRCEEPFPTVQEWNASSFTGVTYYENPMFNEVFQKQVANTKWSLACAPGGHSIWGKPIEMADIDVYTNKKHLLNQKQRTQLNNLVSICFGDEEYYSEERVERFKDWFQLTKELYPEVIVHNNIFRHQWTEHQLRYYMRKARPDMLTFDTYYYHQSAHGNRFGYVIDTTNAIRQLALEGYDGTGRCPLPFGQYLQGFRTGDKGVESGNYTMSQSQINLVMYLTIGMGGKWMNLFRWEYSDNSMLSHENRETKESFDHYTITCDKINRLSPYMVQLTSSRIHVIPGKKKSGHNVSHNALPKTVEPIDYSKDELFESINAEVSYRHNLVATGDLLIGRFKPLKGTSIEQQNRRNFFMVVNGLTMYGSGYSHENYQKIFLRLKGIKTLYRISQETGYEEEILLEQIGESNIYKYTFSIEGGVGELFRY